MGLDLLLKVDGVPNAELAKATRVEVTEEIGKTTFFSIHYPVDIEEGDMTMLGEEGIGPDSVVSILTPVDGMLECLVQGPVSRQKIHLETAGSGSAIEVHGGDSSLWLNQGVVFQKWLEGKDSQTVRTILASQRQGGQPIPLMDVKETDTTRQESKHSLNQRQTPLNLIRQLARNNGFQFWITVDAWGVETAHFKPLPLKEEPEVTLIINGKDCNVERFDLDWDLARPTKVENIQVSLNNAQNILGVVEQSSIRALQPLLGNRGLQQIRGSGLAATVQIRTPVDDAGDILARSRGVLMEADWFISAECRTSLHRLCRLLRTHTVVNVAMAGTRHSGKYLVQRVQHRIDETAHVMEIQLRRNAWNI